MNGYWVSDSITMLLICSGIATIPLIGWFIGQIANRPTARWTSWALTFAAVFLTERMSAEEPAGTRMLLIIAALLLAMKSVVYVESKAEFKFTDWILFSMLWFGMRPELFSQKRLKRNLEWKPYVFKGMLRLALGILLIVSARFLWVAWKPKIDDLRIWIITAVLMLGLSFTVHFGIFNLLVGFWRWRGVKVSPLFKAPLLSKSLTEFWGQRWNLAFSEMTALAVFRPISRQISANPNGKGIAMTVAFVFSGLLHELAVSVPPLAGFGWPTLYFVLHGFAMLIEVRCKKQGLRWLSSSIWGRVWTLSWILLPLPLLFHRPFLEGCVWPIIAW